LRAVPHTMQLDFLFITVLFSDKLTCQWAAWEKDSQAIPVKFGEA
jgi:hypothetical protein